MTVRFGMAAAALALALAGCGKHEDHSVRHIIGKAQGPNANGGVSSEPQLVYLKRVKAEGYAQQPEFFVAERAGGMEKFPCNKCHNKPMEQLRKAQQGKKAAHWEVKLVHAKAETMDCNTCHAKDDLNSLATLKQQKIDINHAYQLCAQCHSRQAADWAGGAHGKRLSGWAPPRVVSSCTGCHNPHKPKLEPRMPVLAGRSPEVAGRRETR
jgi:hypothetical protein